jgi:hypothetical protein
MILTSRDPDHDSRVRRNFFPVNADDAFPAKEVKQMTILITVPAELTHGRNACQHNLHVFVQDRPAPNTLRHFGPHRLPFDRLDFKIPAHLTPLARVCFMLSSTNVNRYAENAPFLPGHSRKD